MKFQLLALLLLSQAALTSAFAITSESYMPTKLDFGINISTQPLYTEIISPTLSRQWYYLKTPNAGNLNKALDKNEVQGTITAFDIKTYPLASKASWTEQRTELRQNITYYNVSVFDPLKNKTVNETRQNITTYNYTYLVPKINWTASNTASNVVKNAEYLMSVDTSPLKGGSWSYISPQIQFDPTISACGAIGSSGTYTLTQNINTTGATCLSVSAANVEIDCAGYSITGDGTGSTYGVYTYAANTTVRNCVIRNFHSSIKFDGSQNSTARNNTMTQNGYAAIWLASSATNNLVINNTFNNSAYGVLLYTGNFDGTNMTNNTYTGIASGTIYVSITGGTSIFDGEKMPAAQPFGTLTASGGNVTVRNSLINLSGSMVMTAYTALENSIVDSTTTSVSCASNEATGCLVRNNTIYSVEAADGAVKTSGTAPHVIRDNNLATCVRCVGIKGSNALIENNDVHGSSIPILPWGSTGNNTFRNNRVWNSGGTFSSVLTVGDTSALHILNNTFYMEGGAPAWQEYSGGSYTNCRFINNTLRNGTAGVHAIDLSSASTGNNITGNNFSISAGKWISNAGTANFNDSTMGNIYYYTNGSNVWQYQSWTGQPWATGGSPLPVNATTFSSYWTGSGGDWHPYNGAGTAGNTSNLTVLCGAGGSSCITNASNFAVPANKTINATAQTNYVFSNWTIISGACTINNTLYNNTFAIFGDASDNCTVQANFNYTAPNTPPTIQFVQALPNPATTSDTLQCRINATDAESTSLNGGYEWYWNGTNQTTLAGTFTGYANGTNSSIASLIMNTSTTGNWSCRVRMFDGLNYSSWNMSNNATVIPAPPHVLNVSITYPSNGTSFGPAQCWMLAQVNTTGSEPSGTTQCRFYRNNVLIQSINHSYANNTLLDFNFTVVNSTETNYAINCTSEDGTVANISQTVEFDIIGSSFCAAPTPTPTVSGGGGYNPVWIVFSTVWLGGVLLVIFGEYRKDRKAYKEQKL